MTIGTTLREEFRAVRVASFSVLALEAASFLGVFFAVKAFIAIPTEILIAGIGWLFAIEACTQFNITRQTTPVLRGIASGIFSVAIAAPMIWIASGPPLSEGLVGFCSLLVIGFI